MACRCSVRPRSTGGGCRSACDDHQLDPFADRVGGQFRREVEVGAHRDRRVGEVHDAPRAAAAGSTIRQGAGPGTSTRASSEPTWSTAMMICCAPPLSQSMAASGSSGGLPSRTSRGSRGSLRRSAMICAAQRFPRPTWRNNCLSVQSGQVGTGVDGSAPRISSPKAWVWSSSAARKSTSRTYSGARLAKRDRKRRPPAQYPGVPAAAAAGQPRVREALEEGPQPDLALRRGPARPRGRSADRRRTTGACPRSRVRCRSGADRRRPSGRGWHRRDRGCTPSLRRTTVPATSMSFVAIRALSCTGESSRRISSTAVGHSSGALARVSRCSGVSSSIRIPLPSRLTVVSKPAASTRPAVASSSWCVSGPPSASRKPR